MDELEQYKKALRLACKESRFSICPPDSAECRTCSFQKGTFPPGWVASCWMRYYLDRAEEQNNG